MRNRSAVLEMYKNCQAASLSRYSLCGKQNYVEPFIIEKQGRGVTFDYLIGTEEARLWYVDHTIEDIGDSCVSENGERLRTVREGDVVLDCGAHTGFLTTYFATIAGPAGHVVAFDPFPQNADLIEHNAMLNGLTNVTVVRKAVGSENKFLTLSQSNQNASVSTADDSILTFETTIDSWAFLNPSVLKLDVEGYEVEALKGAQKVLATRPILNLEVHGPLLHVFGHSANDVLNLIPGLDAYDYYIKETVPGVGSRGDFRKLQEFALDGSCFTAMLGFPKSSVKRLMPNAIDHRITVGWNSNYQV